MKTTPNCCVQEHHWYALRTRPKTEKWLQKKFSERKITTYLPLRKIVRKYTRKNKIIYLPLIPGYIFAYISKTEYIAVLQMPNIIGFVHSSKGPARIPEHEILLLKRVTGESSTIELAPLSLQKGDLVEIIAGNLTGLTGYVVHSMENAFLLIHLQTTGFSLRIQVKPQNLRLLHRNA